jgi:hypothetical protein
MHRLDSSKELKARRDHRRWRGEKLQSLVARSVNKRSSLARKAPASSRSDDVTGVALEEDFVMELVLGLGMRSVGFSLGAKGASRRLETVLRASRYAGLTLAGMTPCAT